MPGCGARCLPGVLGTGPARVQASSAAGGCWGRSTSQGRQGAWRTRAAQWMRSRGSAGGPRAGWPVRRALASSGDDGAATGARGLVFLSAGLRRKARTAPARTFLRTRAYSWPDRSPQVGQCGRAGGRCTQKCEQGGSGISDPWPIGHEVANGREIWPHHLRSHSRGTRQLSFDSEVSRVQPVDLGRLGWMSTSGGVSGS